MSYFNPNLFPYQADNLGSLLGKKDGSRFNWSQENGIQAGEPIFHPPKLLRDFGGIFAAITAANRPVINYNTVMSLNAKNASGTLLFTTDMAKVLMQYMKGIATITVDKIPPASQHGVYDPNNAVATRFGALDITRRDQGQVIPVGRDDIYAVQLGAALVAQPGDWIMAAHALTSDFGKVAPLLDYQTDAGVVAGGTGTNDLVLTKAFAMQVLSVVGNLDPTYNRWINGTTYLSPNRDASQIQIFDVDIADQGGGAPTSHTIVYKYWSLGDIIPPEQIFKVILGKCVMSTGVAGEIIAMEVE